ncbi:hypothetical protein ACOMHN_052667 [Nucella lapillus]
MPSRDVAYVDHTCKLPTPSIVAYLVYYFILVASCGYLAFKTRLLPDSFNESRFITICVCTSMAISIGFIPTYLASERNLVKTLIMMLLVFLNHSMALVFLFLPKVYAMVYIPETTLFSFKRSAFRSGIGKGPPGLAMSTFMTASVVLQDTLCVKRLPD